MNYQAAASEVEAHHLAEQQRDSLPAASTFNIDTFCFDYLTLNDSDTLKVRNISFDLPVPLPNYLNLLIAGKTKNNGFYHFRQHFECLLIWVY